MKSRLKFGLIGIAAISLVLSVVLPVGIYAQPVSGVSKDGYWGACPNGLTHVGDFVRDNRLKVTLVGDNKSTTKCILLLQNSATGKTSTVSLRTDCVSKKTSKVPAESWTAKKLEYEVVPTAIPLIQIMRAAEKLDKAGAYKDLPFLAEGRAGKIKQLAIWSYIGGHDDKLPDAITAKLVTEDLLSAVKENGLVVSENQKKTLSVNVNKILEKVALTEKEARTISVDDLKQVEAAKEPLAADEAKPESEQQNKRLFVPKYTTFRSMQAGYQNMCTSEDAQLSPP